ncbi:MAG: carboxypeptidase regulatory-like domain-containing protein [Candidatus Methanomethylophilus sp.]|nr:carboxypeptidase regulatory-like domain-containing protein [Methanomethylophilus sp.]MDD3233263.1 carboxypeptidase regulatory-like domain-containing protein [Methanomethylophilus sp.]MDD4221774.1 carboxypeptidase regulatory-like domain-containing protein [Methanomethylophilus sp.]MDD4668641.1 carboxypeptidase regulatory-like domain-containing protein [Methanomethylophilus sp.]
MSSRTAAVFAVMLVLFTAVGILATDESAADNSDTDDPATETVYAVAGYVVEDQAAGNVPMAGVGVIVNDGVNSLSAVTDSDGYFTVTVASTDKVTISFTYTGYTVRSCPHGTLNTATGTISLDLTGITPILTTADDVTTYTYLFTSEADGLQPVIMSGTDGIVVVTVTEESDNHVKTVSGASVSLVSATDGAVRYSGTTDSDGKFTFSGVQTGYYYLTSTCNGFYDSSSQTVTVATGSTYFSVSLTEIPVENYLGMSLGHLLMVIGIILGVVLILIVGSLCRRPERTAADMDTSDLELGEKESEEDETEEEGLRPGSGAL